MPANFIRNRQYMHGRRANWLYEYLGRKYSDATTWHFMNYGYAPADDPHPFQLRYTDQEIYAAQLYYFVASRAPTEGRDVLDVGSGRGGGARLIQQELGPKSTTGMDLANSAVDFCNQVHGHIDGLKYVQGNSMDMPFEDQSFDLVTNVESMHCYPSKEQFISEVHRVLRPGGSFVMADFFERDQGVDEILATQGFEIVSTTDITAGVANAMTLDTGRRKEQIKVMAPRLLRRFFGLWAGTDGSWIHRHFVEGHRSYQVIHARKSA